MANESLKDRFNNMMGFGGEEKYNDDQYVDKYSGSRKYKFGQRERERAGARCEHS